MIKPLENTCTGCRACEVSCPKACISMISNNNGFLLPVVDETVCIDCGRCETICPVIRTPDKSSTKKVFAAYLKSEAIKNSASGGIFYALAKKWLESKRGGACVYGAAFDKLCLKIQEVLFTEDLRKLQGSKYLQADTGSTYKDILKHLQNGENVLYSGTPCQIAGLKKVIGTKDTENLLTVELVCHGVASPVMFADYIDWLEEKNGEKVSGYCFRTKSAKGRDFHCLINYANGSEMLVSGFQDPFYKIYMESTSLRQICYECPFATVERVADITLGDFWNIEDLDVKFGLKDRVSVVLLNSEKGINAWKLISSDIAAIETELKFAYKGNANLCRISGRPNGYFEYGNVKQSSFFDEVSGRPGNKKKEMFNKLPAILRRYLKKLLK